MTCPRCGLGAYLRETFLGWVCRFCGWDGPDEP